MKARVFTYCKDCALRNTGDCPVSQWCEETAGGGGYVTMGGDYFYCGAGFPLRLAFKYNGKAGKINAREHRQAQGAGQPLERGLGPRGAVQIRGAGLRGNGDAPHPQEPARGRRRGTVHRPAAGYEPHRHGGPGAGRIKSGDFRGENFRKSPKRKTYFSTCLYFARI